MKKLLGLNERESDSFKFNDLNENLALQSRQFHELYSKIRPN